MSGREALEKRLGHRFTNAALLGQALTHRSAGTGDNERLEFLGDGVLGCAVAEELYARFPGLAEGTLTRMRARLVSKEALTEIAGHLEIGKLLKVGAKHPVTPSVLADAVEALFGAVFLDGGYGAARQAMLHTFGALLDGLDAGGAGKDAKTELQELMHAQGRKLPEYRVVATHGAPHQRSFEVECALPELGVSAVGKGTSLQRAEQQAAKGLLQQLLK
ncbi:MAG: ribonuclease III [Betaproteobacteria bacterium]